VSEDPLREAGGPNAYLYAIDDPLYFVDPLGLRWSFYKWLYTGAFLGGNGNASDEIYRAAIEAAGTYVYCHGAARGFSAGVSFSSEDQAISPALGFGGSWSIDNGWGGEGNLGGAWNLGDQTSVQLAGGIGWSQGEGWGRGGGIGSETDSLGASSGYARGQIGPLNLGVRYGVFNIGIIVDVLRVPRNFVDSYSVITGRSLTDDSCECSQ
jgi:hypothetical protein